ncbi:MAG: hypothetical protein EZS28_024120, partial [Streblomastix strix]
SDYLSRLAKMQHSDYISGYMAMGEVLKTMSIHPQSFTISKQQFFDQPIDSLNSSGVKYIRAPLAARGTATCSMVRTCQVNWTITILKNTLAIQINKVTATAPTSDATANAIIKFNADADVDTAQGDMTAATQEYSDTEVLHFWLGFSTACGPFNQFAIYKDSTKLWDTSIYAKEQAVICSNSLSDLCTNNSVSVSPLESIESGKRHCVVFIDVKISDIIANAADVRPPLAPATPSYYLIADDITFIDELRIIIFIALDARFLIRFEGQKPHIIYLLKAVAANIWRTGNSLQSIMSFANIKSLFMTFAMPQYPTWFFPVLFQGFDLINDQRHVIPTPYEALTQTTNGAKFDCFVDQDVVSAPSDLYHSLTFENIHVKDGENQYYGSEGNVWQDTDNLFYATTLYNGSKATKTIYPNKFMLA